jgi:peptidyl-prolyl cis-trans isomerase C
VRRWALVLLAACAQRTEQRAAVETAALGGDVAARVGTAAIPLSVVVGVASAQNVGVKEALRRVIDDEIAASAARARALETTQPAAWRLRAARARFVTERLREQAQARGQPTDDEVKRLSERHWQEVDRPPAVRVIHAIVLRPKDAALFRGAVHAAEEMKRALAPAESEADFESRAKSVPAAPERSSVEIRVERLPPFTEDGRIIDGRGQMDATFAKAAHALRAPGDTTGIVETPFGWHVIRLLEQIPEKRMPIETRRLAFTAEANAMRATEALDAILNRARAAHPISMAEAAEPLMRTAVVGVIGPTP